MPEQGRLQVIISLITKALLLLKRRVFLSESLDPYFSKNKNIMLPGIRKKHNK